MRCGCTTGRRTARPWTQSSSGTWWSSSMPRRKSRANGADPDKTILRPGGCTRQWVVEELVEPLRALMAECPNKKWVFVDPSWILRDQSCRTKLNEQRRFEALAKDGTQLEVVLLNTSHDAVDVHELMQMHRVRLADHVDLYMLSGSCRGQP